MKKLLLLKIYFTLLITISSSTYANEFMENLEEIRKKNNNIEIKNQAKKRELKDIFYRESCAYDAGEAKTNYEAKKIETICLKAYGLK